MFVQGTVADQGRFYDRFDAILLLTAPAEVLLDRIERRKNNPFGKTPTERSRIVADIDDVEPLLRISATHEIDTRRPLEEVVDDLVRDRRRSGSDLVSYSCPWMVSEQVCVIADRARALVQHGADAVTNSIARR